MRDSERNLKGKELEKAGDIEGAIELYEKNLEVKSKAPHPYKRLALIYRKRKDFTNEVRVLKELVSLSENEAKKYGWKEGSKQFDKIVSYRKQLENALEKLSRKC